jgi:hypothetical protein
MEDMTMRQHTFISFMCCPEWRGLLTNLDNQDNTKPNER